MNTDFVLIAMLVAIPLIIVLVVDHLARSRQNKAKKVARRSKARTQR